MGTRLELQTMLETVTYCKNIYFQPPESLKLSYPCIIYNLSAEDTKFADDKPYVRQRRYQVTVIDKNPDSVIPDKIASLPKCIFDRHFTSDNLNHDVYNLYY